MATATAKPGTPVPPPGPTCSLKNVASFRPGTWNDVPVTADDLRDMAKTFAELKGYYTPFLSLNHDDGLAFGKVSNVEYRHGVMYVDGEAIPKEVGGLINGGRLQAPSIEFWEPGDFVMPDGSPNKTRVFKCLTLLGNQPPGVKGLGPLPAAKFADGAKAKRFGPPCKAKKYDDSNGEGDMDRQAMIEALKAAGMDVSMVTDAVPDEVLKAMLECVQKAANPAPEPQAMADDVPGVTAVPNSAPAPVPTPLPSTNPAPSAVTIKFKDRHGRDRSGTLQDFADDQAAALTALRANSTALSRVQVQQLADAKAAKVKRFRDEMTGSAGGKAYMTPAQFDAVEPLLLAADDVAVRKFKDGKATGSALDEALAGLKAAHPNPVKTFGDKMKDPHGTGGTLANPSGLTPEKRREILGGSPAGKAVLAAERKK